MEYDQNGNALRIFDALNHKTELTYDSRGLVTRSTDARNQSTNFVYDAQGNLRSVTDPLNRKTELTTDDRGNVTRVKDPLNRETVFSYDTMNRLTGVTDAMTGHTVYGYDTRGSLLSVEDALHRVTGFEYDGRGRVRFVTNPLGEKTEYRYGPVTSGVEADTITQVPPSPDTRTQYYNFDGPRGCLASAGAGFGYFTYGCDNGFCQSCGLIGSGPLHDAGRQGSFPGSETFFYDAAQRLSLGWVHYRELGEMDKLPTYDAAGNRTSLKIRKRPDDGKDLTWTYGYDSLNRLTTQTDWRNQPYTYTYDELSRRTSLTRPNGIKTEYTYDNASQLTSIMHKDQNDNVVLGIAYEYDAAGNRTAITYTGLHPTLQGRHTYTYDDLNRLTGADHPSDSILPDESYTYDAVGNRLTSHLSSTYTYNAANRLLSDDTFTYTYDKVGSLTRRTRIANNAKLEILNTQSGLFSMDDWKPEVGPERYEITDGLMRRTHEIEPLGGGHIRPKKAWVYDNEDWILEYTMTGDTTNPYVGIKSDIAKIATHGPGIDEPLMISIRNDLVPTLMAGPGGLLTCSTCMQDVYPLTDALGSVLALVDDTGALVQTYAYDSFGRVLSDAGGIPNDYGYTGRELDRSTGMMFYRHRWYEAETGRFVAEDPDRGSRFIPESLNRYAYSRNSPTVMFDPWGLKSKKSKSGKSCPIDAPDCVDAPPLTPDAPNPYGPGDYYKDINAEMMFDVTDNEPWSNCVRGCLACMHKKGVDPDTAHSVCYWGCAKKHPLHAGSGFLHAVGAAIAIAAGQLLGMTPP